MTLLEKSLDSKLDELMEIQEQDRDLLVVKWKKNLETKNLGGGGVATASPKIGWAANKTVSTFWCLAKKLTRGPLRRLVKEEGITRVEKSSLTFKTKVRFPG